MTVQDLLFGNPYLLGEPKEEGLETLENKVEILKRPRKAE